MRFVNELEIGKKAIIDKYPEFENSSFTGDNSGWDNYAIKVDNKYIFRFPRDEGAYRVINMEYDVLGYLNTELPSNIRVPKYIFSNLDSDFPFVGYEIIQGKFLSKELYESLSDEEKEKFLTNMATFISTLHKLDVNRFNLDRIEIYSNYKMRYDEFRKKCFKYFDDELKNKTVSLFESYLNNDEMKNYKDTVVHGDLSTDHIIITENGVGIIDFGDIRIFDPAYDFEWAYLLGEDVFDKVFEKYTVNRDDRFKDRISFYAKIVPYYGIVYAEETKNEKMLKEEVKKLRKIL